MRAGRLPRLGVGLCLLVAGCAPTGQGSAPSESPTATATPTVSTSSTPVAVNINCRLPVHLTNSVTTGGWLAFPSGQFSTDPAANVTPPPSSLSSADRSYNWRYKRWVPVPWNAQSPDASRYAYAAPEGIHVVDASSGSDRLIARTSGLIVIKFEPEGIYGRKANGSELWRVNPVTGRVEQVLNQGQWFTVGHGAAWGFSPGTINNRWLVRVDLRDASTTVWYSAAPVMDVLGVDSAGRPIVAVGGANWRQGNVQMQIRVLTAPEFGSTFYPTAGPWNLAFFENDWQASSDTHGVWVPWPDGIYLLTSGPNPTLAKVTVGTALPAGVCN
jgi:hypothetical protein